MRLPFRLAILLASLVLAHIPQCPAATAIAPADWSNLRGFTIKPSVSKADIADVAATGANLVRVDFTTMPLLSKEPPYAIDERALRQLDDVISWCAEFQMNVIIDPHTVPGAKLSTTTLPTDEIWRSRTKQQSLVNLWNMLSRRYRGNTTVIGYDLLNEPSAKYRITPVAGTEMWNDLVVRIIRAIRHNGDDHYVIVEPAVVFNDKKIVVNRFEGLRLLDVPPDRRIVISPHMYMPGNFTHEGLYGIPVVCRYPGRCDGSFWNKAALEAAMAPALAASKSMNAPVYIGEFSASIYTGEDGTRYLHDLIEIFEEHRWAWTYHMFRGAPAWDPERAPDRRDSAAAPQPRLAMIEEFLGRNHSGSPAR